MKLTRRQLASVVLDYTDSAESTSVASRNIAAYLIENRRVSELDALLREVSALRTARSGQVEISAVSAFPISGDIKREVANIFGAKRAVFNESLDNSVLGGARFESLDKRLDLSLRSKLNRLNSVKV